MELFQSINISGDSKQMVRFLSLTKDTNGYFNFELFAPRLSIKRLQLLTKLFSKIILEYSYSKDGKVETFYEIEKGKIINSGERLVDGDSP